MANDEKAGEGRWPWAGAVRVLLVTTVALRVLIGASELGWATAAADPAGATKAPTEAPAVTRPRGAREVARLVDAVARRQAELEEREREIAGRADLLAEQERHVGEEVARLEALEAKLGDRLAQNAEAEDAAATSLAKVYAAMKPDEAAKILGELDDDTLLRIVARMRSKELGLILSRLDAKKAVVVTTRLARTS